MEPSFYDYVKYMAGLSRFFCRYAAKDNHHIPGHIFMCDIHGTRRAERVTDTQVSCVKMFASWTSDLNWNCVDLIIT